MTAESRERDVERDLVDLNREVFETGLEMNMVMLETASRLAEEYTAFLARRAQSNAVEAADFANAASPRDVWNWQQRRMRRLLDDYTSETSRLVEIGDRALREGTEAVRTVTRS